MKNEVIIKACVSIVWLMLWSTPFIVGVFGGSWLFVVIGIVWGVVMKMFTDKFCPSWIMTAWEEVFPGDE